MSTHTSVCYRCLMEVDECAVSQSLPWSLPQRSIPLWLMLWVGTGYCYLLNVSAQSRNEMQKASRLLLNQWFWYELVWYETVFRVVAFVAMRILISMIRLCWLRSCGCKGISKLVCPSSVRTFCTAGVERWSLCRWIWFSLFELSMRLWFAYQASHALLVWNLLNDWLLLDHWTWFVLL